MTTICLGKQISIPPFMGGPFLFSLFIPKSSLDRSVCNNNKHLEKSFTRAEFPKDRKTGAKLLSLSSLFSESKKEKIR